MASVVNVCGICKLSDTNTLDYGEWKTYDGLTVHYFCALLSLNGMQKGEDHEGFRDFLAHDIQTSADFHKNIVCCYCKKPNASVRCADANCQRYFHVVCGTQNKCLLKFVDPFPCYCDQHVEINEVYKPHGSHWHCQICLEKMGEYHPITSIPSCCNHGYFHKRCIQQWPVKAGNFTKCPCCGDHPLEYQQFLRQRGIFCPNKGADYEPSPKKGLLDKQKQPNAADCVPPKALNQSVKLGYEDEVADVDCNGDRLNKLYAETELPAALPKSP